MSGLFILYLFIAFITWLFAIATFDVAWPERIGLAFLVALCWPVLLVCEWFAPKGKQ